MPDLFVAPNDNKDPKANIATPTTYRAGMFATYRENPSNITFGAQEPNETVLLFLRRDFITNVSWIAVGVVLYLAPTFFIVLAKVMNNTLVSLPMNFAFIL